MVSDAVFKTVSFFDVLNFAPTPGEVHAFLLFSDASKDAVERALRNDSRYGTNGQYFALPGRESLFDIRRQKMTQTEILLKRVQKFLFLIRLLPFVRGAALCNNLPLGNVIEASDIDLFIVAKKNRLFLARFFGTLLFHVFGIRRHGSKIAGRFCLSFWLSEEHLNISDMAFTQDPYLAFWMRSLLPLTGKEIFQQFFHANAAWLEGYFPGRYSGLSSGEQFSVPKSSLFNALDGFLAHYQLRRIEARRKLLPVDSGIVATHKMLKFHDHDRRGEYAAAWQKRLTAYSGSYSRGLSADS